ncbi:MAG: DinB family protein, partial [Pyrinomonadaceae bacterium]
FTALLEFLNETPNKLTSLTAGLSDAELQFQNSLDEFSVLENICHLRDLEVQGYTPRIRRILAEANPALADFDGGRVAAESDYNNEPPGVALRAFQTAREENVAVLRVLSEADLKREGTLAGVGSITLRRLAEMMREHDEGHLDDLRVLGQRLAQACRQ